MTPTTWRGVAALALLWSACGPSPPAPSQTPQPPSPCPIDAARPASPTTCASPACAAHPGCLGLPKADRDAPLIRLLSDPRTDEPTLDLEVEIEDESPLLEVRVALGGQAPRALERAPQALPADTSARASRWRARITLEIGQTPLLVQATDIAGQTARLEATLTRVARLSPVELPLRAEFSWSGAEQVGRPLQVDASPTREPEGARTLYRWDFGDGATGQGRRASHLYTSAGDHLVTLRVTDLRDGAQSVKLQVVTVHASPTTDSPAQRATIWTSARDPSGQALPGARVSARLATPDSAQTDAQTDATGLATLTLDGPLGVLARVEAQAPGFAPAWLQAQLREQLSLELTLNPLERAPIVHGEPGSPWLASARGISLEGSPQALEALGASPSVALAQGQPPDTSRALDAQGRPVAMDARGAAYVSITHEDSGHLASLDPGSRVTLTLPVDDALQVGESITLWRQDAQGVWIEAGQAQVIDHEGRRVVQTPIHATGWWAAGQALALEAQLSLRCARAAQATPCTATLTHEAHDGFRAILSSETILALPAGRVCAAARSSAGSCAAAPQCQSASAGQLTELTIALECPLDALDALSLPALTPPLEVTPQRAEHRWRVEGQAGQALTLALTSLWSDRFDGELRVRTADGVLLAQDAIREAAAGVILVLPYTGDFVVEVEAAGADQTGRFTLAASALEVIALDSLTQSVVPEPLTRFQVLDRVFYYPGQGALINAAHFSALDHTTLSVVDARGQSYHGARARLVRGQSRPLADVGPVELPRAGYYRLRMSFGEFGQDAGVPYSLALVGLPAPRALSFDATGRAIAQDQVRVLGDRHLYTMTLSQGDGVQARLEGVGPTSQARLNRATLWIGRVGAGRVTAPQQRLWGADRDYGFQGALADHAWRAPESGEYTLEIVHFGYEDGADEPGRYQLTVDRVDAFAQTLHVDPTLSDPQAATRSLPAAVLAASSGATITLGARDHKIEVPLKLYRSGVTIQGADPQQTRITYAQPRLYSESARHAVVEVRAGGVALSALTLARPANLAGHQITQEASLLHVTSIPSSGLGVEVDYAQADTITLQDVTLLHAPTGAHRLMSADGIQGFGAGATGPLPRLVARRVRGSGGYSGMTFAGESAQVEDSELEATGYAQPALDLELRGGAQIRRNTLRGDRTLSLRPMYALGPSIIQIEDNTLWASGGETSVIVSQGTNPQDGATRQLRFERNRFDHSAPRYLQQLWISTRDPALALVIHANTLRTYQGGGVRVDALSGLGPVTITNNLIEGSSFYEGIALQNVQLMGPAWLAHNTLLTPSCASRPPVLVRVSAPSVTQTALPITLRHNLIVAQMTTSTCAGIGLEQANATPQSFTMDSADNLIYGITTPWRGPWTSRAASAELLGLDPRVDLATGRPGPGSPAIDAVACLSGLSAWPSLGPSVDLSVDLSGSPRPHGERCDVGALEQ